MKAEKISRNLALKRRILRNIVVDKKTGCWIWQRKLRPDGYGVMSLRIGRSHPVPHYVHRVAFEVFKGRLNSSLQVDHICAIRACCNPDHLRQVTPSKNARYREKLKRLRDSGNKKIDWGSYFRNGVIVRA